jgi:hypothetical protein
MRTFNLTCEAVEATLPDYLDESLETWVRDSIEEHLGGCTRCAALARDLRNIERETGALPALVPARDIWPEVAQGIGAPVITSEPEPEIEPVLPPSEPPLSASAPLAISEPAEPTVEPAEPTVEAAQPTIEPSPPASEPSQPTIELPQATIEPSQPTMESPPPAAEAPVSTTAHPISLAERREKRWGPAWVGLAAAALVLVTAGSTFLLTERWIGPVRTTYVVSDTSNRRLSASLTPPGGQGIRAPSAGREQAVSDSSAPTLSSAPLPSSLALATASAPQVTRSPDEVVYDKEISMLQTMRRRRKDELDGPTAAVIERNLRIIDSEIAQIRAALQKDPGSPVLGDQVSRALELKVELLRRVAMLRSYT